MEFRNLRTSVSYNSILYLLPVTSVSLTCHYWLPNIVVSIDWCPKSHRSIFWTEVVQMLEIGETVEVAVDIVVFELTATEVFLSSVGPVNNRVSVSYGRQSMCPQTEESIGESNGVLSRSCDLRQQHASLNILHVCKIIML